MAPSVNTVLRLLGVVVAIQTVTLYLCLNSKQDHVKTDILSRMRVFQPKLPGQNLTKFKTAINSSNSDLIQMSDNNMGLTKRTRENKTEQQYMTNENVSRTIEDLNNQRVESLRQFCAKYQSTIIQTYPRYTKTDVKKTGVARYTWMNSERHQLFYCAAPKCGSTTWKSYLMENLKLNWTGQDVHE